MDEYLTNVSGDCTKVLQPYEIKVLYRSNFAEYIKSGYFFYENSTTGELGIAVADAGILPQAYQIAATQNFSVQVLDKQDFYDLLHAEFSDLNLIISKNLLELITQEATARHIKYKMLVASFCIFLVLIALTSSTLFHIISSLCYGMQNILKLILFKVAIFEPETNPNETPIADIELPEYTVLIPLYKEEKLADEVLQMIAEINYPRDKLDVKIIVEEDDHPTIAALESHLIPEYVCIIKVPHSAPRTKAKAMNYAAQYATGKYLAIYDAEDRPHPNQLRQAAHMFQTLPEEYVCLQSRLNFYNSDENLLSKFFSLEYHIWFDYLLKGLSILKLPITLGGTSNHFKTEILHKIGLWDSYNVTEDADLGLRLAYQGYKVQILDSVTLEEAPISLSNWMHQRSRWIKGFMQTCIVFLGQKNLLSKIGLRQFTVVCVLVGISCYNLFCLPWIILLACIKLTPLVQHMWIINSFFSFSYYATSYYVVMVRKGGFRQMSCLDWLGIILSPCYLALHTVACYKAIWEIYTKPFEWNKTEHGLSAITKFAR